MNIQPSTFAKAIVPLVVGVVSIFIQYYLTGEFNEAEFNTALTTLITAVVVYLTPNRPKLVH